METGDWEALESIGKLLGVRGTRMETPREENKEGILVEGRLDTLPVTETDGKSAGKRAASSACFHPGITPGRNAY